MSMTLLQRVEVGNGGAASIDFTSIPQNYTDLQIVYSTRSVYDNIYITWTGLLVRANGSTANYSGKMLEGNGASAYSQNNDVTTQWNYAASPDSATTANTFSNGSIYIPNYASSNAKSISMDRVTENNATQSSQLIYAGLWNDSAAITSISMIGGDGNLAAGSTASLYGINRQSAIGKPKAIGGNITFANGHWYHTFTGSGTFNAQKNLTCEALVVAGGAGGATFSYGGGGGAGGAVVSTLSVPAGATPVVIGAGGTPSANGYNSVFSSITAYGGGAGGYQEGTGASGGSGGGGGGRYGSTSTPASGGSGIAGQGYAGGSSNNQSAGGGGGAGGLGGNSSGYRSNAGNGGIGIVWNGSYYAGGGGGGVGPDGSNVPGAGGLGGGGIGGKSGANAGSGTVNTGGGGGGYGYPVSSTGSGGSGIVIIRYPAD